MRRVAGACGAVLILLASMAMSTSTASSGVQGSPSSPILYTLTGVTLTDGGTLTGSFVFDPSVPCQLGSCTAYSSVAITSSSGSDCFAGGDRTYGTYNTTTTSEFISFGAPDYALSLQLFFAAPLGTSTTISIEAFSDERDGTGCQRDVVSGSVASSEIAPPATGTDATGTDAAQTDMCHATDDGGFELVRLSASAAITDHGHHSDDIIPSRRDRSPTTNTRPPHACTAGSTYPESGPSSGPEPSPGAEVPLPGLPGVVPLPGLPGVVVEMRPGSQRRPISVLVSRPG